MAGVSTWTISPGFYFRGVAGGGGIEFQGVTDMYGWSFGGGYVIFDQLILGSRIWNTLGVNCSSNANMSLVTSDGVSLTYIVNATAGQVSTTQFIFPAGVTIEGVSGASSYAANGNLLTVLVTHTSTATVRVYFSGVASAIDNVRNVWGNMFFLVVVVASFAYLERASRGEEGFLPLIIALVVFTAIFIGLLDFLERLLS